MSKPGNTSVFSVSFLAEVEEIARQLDTAAIEKMVASLVRVREGSGRLFILGVGGSAANASHAVNDFRKLAGIEAYAPTDNVSELTARVNDEGWPTVFAAWLRTSHLQPRDAVLVFSVGGGSVERNVSPNIVVALDYARSVGAEHPRNRRPRWWLYRTRSRCLRAHSHGSSGSHHAPCRGLSSHRLAPTGLASCAATDRDEVGVSSRPEHCAAPFFWTAMAC